MAQLLCAPLLVGLCVCYSLPLTIIMIFPIQVDCKYLLIIFHPFLRCSTIGGIVVASVSLFFSIFLEPSVHSLVLASGLATLLVAVLWFAVYCNGCRNICLFLIFSVYVCFLLGTVTYQMPSATSRVSPGSVRTFHELYGLKFKHVKKMLRKLERYIMEIKY